MADAWFGLVARFESKFPISAWIVFWKIIQAIGTGRWVELDKHDIDNLVKSVELKPRIGTGLYGMAKRRAERQVENPLPARRGGFLRQQKRDTSVK